MVEETLTTDGVVYIFDATPNATEIEVKVGVKSHTAEHHWSVSVFNGAESFKVNEWGSQQVLGNHVLFFKPKSGDIYFNAGSKVGVHFKAVKKPVEGFSITTSAKFKKMTLTEAGNIGNPEVENAPIYIPSVHIEKHKEHAGVTGTIASASHKISGAVTSHKKTTGFVVVTLAALGYFAYRYYFNNKPKINDKISKIRRSITKLRSSVKNGIADKYKVGL